MDSMAETQDRYEKYGKEHKDAKQARIEKVGSKCEITGEEGSKEHPLNGHHIQPSYLNAAGEKNTEFEYNYMILSEQFHKYLHDITRSEIQGGQLVQQRLDYAKTVWKNPNDKESMKKLQEADDKLIPEFISKLMDNCKFAIREVLLNKTMIALFHTNRDLKIEIRKKDLIIEQMKKELEEAQKSKAVPVESNIVKMPPSNIVHFGKRNLIES